MAFNSKYFQNDGQETGKLESPRWLYLYVFFFVFRTDNCPPSQLSSKLSSAPSREQKDALLSVGSQHSKCERDLANVEYMLASTYRDSGMIEARNNCHPTGNVG